jgi:ketosteroid isomerase-like protein
MQRIAAFGLVLVVLLTACGSTKKPSAQSQAVLQKEANYYEIDQIEKTWHRASSRHDVDLMMTVWAPGATFSDGPDTYNGRAQIRAFFMNKAGSFKPTHHWVSETPAYKLRITANGDKGTLYFECHYADVKTGKIVNTVAADQNVQKIGGKWLITSSVATPVTLTR